MDIRTQPPLEIVFCRYDWIFLGAAKKQAVPTNHFPGFTNLDLKRAKEKETKNMADPIEQP